MAAGIAPFPKRHDPTHIPPGVGPGLDEAGVGPKADREVQSMLVTFFLVMGVLFGVFTFLRFV